VPSLLQPLAAVRTVQLAAVAFEGSAPMGPWYIKLARIDMPSVPL